MFDVHSQGKNDTELVTEGDLLGRFSYAIDSTPIQEFTVKDVSFIAWMTYASTHTHTFCCCAHVLFSFFSLLHFSPTLGGCGLYTHSI